MIALSHRTHLEHMDLKNWTLSLFERGKPLYIYGFKNVEATPSITSNDTSLTPDLISWSSKIVLIIECKAGKPSNEDLKQAKDYKSIPQSSIGKFTGLSTFARKVVLLYYEKKLDSDSKVKEELLSKVALDSDLIVWACEQPFQIKWIAGDHGDEELNSLLKGGLEIHRFPLHQIEIQPDSPIKLLERLVFNKLWERAYRYKDTRFTIGIVREILENHNYALPKGKKRKLQDAIKSGVRDDLCIEEQQGKVWRLNMILESPTTFERYLQKLRELITYPRLEDFSDTK